MAHSFDDVRCTAQRQRSQAAPGGDLHAYVFRTRPCESAKLVGIIGSGTAHADSSAGFGALLLSRAPERIQVSDEQGCDLPDTLAAWAPLALSCFVHPVHGPVPILDIPALLDPPQHPHLSWESAPRSLVSGGIVTGVYPERIRHS